MPANLSVSRVRPWRQPDELRKQHYGFVSSYRRHTGRILNGEKPADLPNPAVHEGRGEVRRVAKHLRPSPGAFIVLVSATVARFGIEGLIATVMLSGVMLTIIGVSRLGVLIRYIPHAVTVGFTCGIAATILVSQLRDLGGLMLDGAEPGPFFPKLAALYHALPTLHYPALAVGLGCAALIFALRAWRPTWPGMLIAVALASLAASLLQLPVETIGSHFGGIPDRLPKPALPRHDWNFLQSILPTALSFTLLGGVESLLSAKVADGMTGRKHRYNMELVAQGVANIASALFGGISVTGTIARTATNIRAGARSPLSGMMHALILLLFMLVAAPLAQFIPLSALAGVLVVVSWYMSEKKEFALLLRDWRTATVLLATFGLTLIEDLTVGIVTGCVLAGILWFAGERVASEDAGEGGDSA
jgi:SulP family sulfate permease